DLQRAGAVLDRAGDDLAPEQLSDEARRARITKRLSLQEVEDATARDAAAIDAREDRGEVEAHGLQQLRLAAGEALQVVGGEQLEVWRGVLAQAQQVVLAVCFDEEGLDHALTEALDIRARGVAQADEQRGGPVLRADVLGQEREHELAGVLP